jgi:TolB protein
MAVRALIVVAVLVAVPAAATGAPAHNGVIVFDHNREGQVSLWSINPDGTGLRKRVTRVDGREAAFSPDGRRLAFVHDQGKKTFGAIYVARADGTHARQLFAGPYDNGSPVFSPDGRRIAFASLRFRPAKPAYLVRIMKANGSHVRTLFTGSFKFGFPSTAGRDLTFSPDGRTIVFDANTRKGSDIFSMNANGSHVRRLTRTPGSGVSYGPAFSPDATKIVFTRQRGPNSSNAVFEMNADGRGTRQLSGDSSSPVFSPDGTEIAYVHVPADAPDFGENELYLINADGTGAHRLTHTLSQNVNTQDNDNPAWRPVP